MINNYKDFNDRSKLTDKKFLESLTIPFLEFEFDGKLHHYNFLEFGIMPNKFVWKYENQDPQEGNNTQFSHYIEFMVSTHFDNKNKMTILVEVFSYQEKFYQCKFKEPNYSNLYQPPRILFSEETENNIEEFINKLSSGRININDIPGESKF